MAVILLVIGAGIALVLQNLVMARITSTSSTMLIALWLNSAVGLVLLTGLIAWRNGGATLGEALGHLRGWGIVPGLFGTFIVFSILSGYRNMNAATVVVVLVASQLIAGLIADIARGQLQGNLAQPLFGAALLIVGAIMVAGR